MFEYVQNRWIYNKITTERITKLCRLKNLNKKAIFGKKKRTFCKIDRYIFLTFFFDFYILYLYLSTISCKIVCCFQISGSFWHLIASNGSISALIKKKRKKKINFFSKVPRLVTLALCYYYSLGHSLLSHKKSHPTVAYSYKKFTKIFFFSKFKFLATKIIYFHINR